MVTDRANIAIANKLEVAYGLFSGIFKFDLGLILKVKVNIMYISISLKWRKIRQTLLLPSIMMLHVRFRLAYLELTLTYFKGQPGRWNVKYVGLVINSQQITAVIL